MTEEDYITMLTAQNGSCAICGGDNNGRSFHIDHNHETGKVRGLLCYRCNSVLGYAKDSVAVLKAATVYLEEVRS